MVSQTQLAGTQGPVGSWATWSDLASKQRENGGRRVLPTHRCCPNSTVLEFLKRRYGSFGSLDELELRLTAVDAVRLRHLDDFPGAKVKNKAGTDSLSQEEKDRVVGDLRNGSYLGVPSVLFVKKTAGAVK
jgi:hypothetical protein